MNLKDLHYLVAVADTRHFGQAAELCHISQPTLSMQIKKLEEHLGVTLFERTNKQVMTTQVGESIILRARSILREAKEIRDIGRMTQSPFAGEFRLGAFPTIAPYFLPDVIPAVIQQLPDLKLLLKEEKTSVLLESLGQGELDAAVIALPVTQEGLESTILFDDPFLLAVPKGHLLGGRSAVTRQDMMGEELLLLEEGHCLREHALEVCSLIGVPERKDFRATSLETLRQMVRAGVGITLMPRIAMRDDGLVYIPFKGHAPTRRIGLVWRKTSVRKQCIELLAQLMVKK